MPLQETSGAASYDAFGGGAPAAPIYIEDVFSTWLYQGNGSGQTITNGIDLAGDGGMVWAKARNEPYNHELFDTARGSLSALISNTADSQNSYGPYDFLSSGFRYRAGYIGNANYSNTSYVSWALRKQPKFFDVVLYTGDGTNNRAIPHNLNSVPGCIIVKATSASLDWGVKHRSLTASQYLVLNDTAAASTALDPWSQNPTSNEFYVNGTAPSLSNGNGIQYVAYLFAHDAGGFGLNGTDNVISCGSYTGNGSATGPVVTLGYEPQWVMIKRATGGAGNWQMLDNMRGMPVGSADATLQANLSNAESSTDYVSPTAKGFQVTSTSSEVNTNASVYVYLAIRRGPMKVPTTGTSVFSPNSTSGTTGTPITTGFPIDLQILGINAGNVLNQRSSTRLTGVNTNGTSNSQFLITSSTAAEAATGSVTLNWGNTGFQVPSLNSGSPIITWNLQRAPGFFDVVCYTGTGDFFTVPTNLGVQPELVFLKRRNSTSDWGVGIKVGDSTNFYSTLRLNSTAALGSLVTAFAGTGIFVPTAFNVSGGTYVAYLFATCPGVQYINSYVGDGTTGRTINCGFTGGARFVCIKATSTTGSWWTFDSARGIVTNNDPALQLNSTAAEVTSADAIDTASSGFIVNQESTCSLNASGVSYLVWAIA